MAYTRADLINAVAENTDLSRREAENVIHVAQDAITRALAAGERVSIFEFGSLHGQVVESRMIRNPATGKKMRAKKTARVHFRPAPVLKAYISGAKRLPKTRLVTDQSLRARG